MNLDGLRAIRHKQEIIPTRTAQDLIDRPKDVDDVYKDHSRTYVPLHGRNESGIEPLVNNFIRHVKEKRVPRGIISADFGYGKTSAGLYLWQKANDARIIAVPPFGMTQLEDFVHATYGWVRYCLSESVPALVPQAEVIYKRYIERSIEALAKRYSASSENLTQMVNDGRVRLDIVPRDIVAFFKEMTSLVRQANFNGLIVIADELQQYLDPEIKSGKVEPLAPLFEVIAQIMASAGQLEFGLMLIMTTKELSRINDQRGDLLDRMRDHRLDLRTSYDDDFPRRLWHRFANSFDFEDLAHHVIDPLTLNSLGQIANRQDLSNGPRTVINAFNLAVDRFLQAEGHIEAYSPHSLMDDFLAGSMHFDGQSHIQARLSRALSAPFVQGNAQHEAAIKLMAAFPQTGVTADIQTTYDLRTAFQTIKTYGFPEWVIEVGDRQNPGFVLRGLETAQESADELTSILREFARHYDPQTAHSMRNVVNTFLELVQAQIFRSEQWTRRQIQAREFMIQASLIVEGAFPNIIQKFPSRLVQICILGDDEQNQEIQTGDCSLIFYLGRYLNQTQVVRQQFLGEGSIDTENHLAEFWLNLMILCGDKLSRNLQERLGRVLDLNEVTVFQVLALAHYLGEQVKRGQLSKPVSQAIETSILKALFDTALSTLFNPALDQDSGLTGPRIIENVVKKLIEARYGDFYVTFITYAQWKDSIRRYIGILEKLGSYSQKIGISPYVDTKDDIAQFFGMATTGFETFISRMPDLVHIENNHFPTRSEMKQGKKGGIRFTLHPLEQMIKDSLEQSQDVRQQNGSTLHALHIDDIQSALELGYKEEEIDFALQLLYARGVAERKGEWIIELERKHIAFSDVLSAVDRFYEEAKEYHSVRESADSSRFWTLASEYRKQLGTLKQNAKEADLIRLSEDLQRDTVSLQSIIQGQLQDIKSDFDRLDALYDEDDAWGEQFITPVHAGLLSNALNQTRISLEQEYQAWLLGRNKINDGLAVIRRLVDHPTLANFSSASSGIIELKQQITTSNRTHSSISRSIQHLRQWRQLAEKWTNLQDTLQRLGNQTFLDELGTLEQSIAIAFNNQNTTAFAQIEIYSRQLEDLSKRVNTLENQAERSFNQFQKDCRELLIRFGGLAENELWLPIVFSSRNPSAVYDNLYVELESRIGKLRDSFYNDWEVIDSSIALLEEIPQFADLQTASAQLNRDYSRLSKVVFPRDTQDTSLYRQHLIDLEKIRRDLSVLKQKIEATQRSVGQPALSDDEQALFKAIQKLSAKGSIKAQELRDTVNTWSDERFWLNIRSLWEKKAAQVWIKYDN